MMGIGTAARLQKRVWSVDYRMAPDHPYPAALDDCMAAYRSLLAERAPHEIVVSGGSAGGNLAAALILRARDEGLPMPAGVILGTPEIDLTESGDSFHTNLGVDPGLRSLMPINMLYADGHDLTHPYLSPLFGDLTGFPPTILTTGHPRSLPVEHCPHAPGTACGRHCGRTACDRGRTAHRFSRQSRRCGNRQGAARFYGARFDIAFSPGNSPVIPRGGCSTRSEQSQTRPTPGYGISINASCGGKASNEGARCSCQLRSPSLKSASPKAVFNSVSDAA